MGALRGGVGEAILSHVEARASDELRCIIVDRGHVNVDRLVRTQAVLVVSPDNNLVSIVSVSIERRLKIRSIFGPYYVILAL